MKTNIIFIIFLFFTLNLFGQWKQLNTAFNSDIKALAKNGNGLFATTSNNGIFYSANSDQNWISKNSGLTNLKVYSISVNNSKVIAGTYGQGVFISTNSGDTWTATGSGISVPYIYALEFLSNNIIAGTGGGGIFRSTNDGFSWVSAGGTTHIVNTIYVTPNYAFIGQGPYAYKSTDNGLSWTNLISSSNTTIKGFAETPKSGGGTNIFVGTLDGVYISTNDGGSWKTSNNGLTYQNINAIVATGQNLFVATENGGVFHSSNNGSNWIAVNTGLPANTNGRALIINNGSLFLGTSLGVVWKRDLIDFGITNVENISNEIPASFHIYQNYPNPFNPTTTIKFSLNKETKVRLLIYDILGNTVNELVNEKLQAGYHSVNWNGTDKNGNSVSSGVYFYELIANDGSNTLRQIKKMNLMK